MKEELDLLESNYWSNSVQISRREDFLKGIQHSGVLELVSIGSWSGLYIFF